MTAVGPCNSSHQNEGSMEQADGRIYEDVSLYDFNFVIIAKGEPKRCFRTNKTLLKVRSPYFRKMLEGEWKESSENETNLKYDAEVIRGMLEFIHTGLLSSVSPVFADEWLALADQLDSNEFKDLVQAGLSNSLNVDNAVTLLCLAHLHKASDLYVNVTAFLHKNAAGVIRNWPTRNLAS